MGYDTRRRAPDGVIALVSQTAVYDTCGSATPVSQRRMPPKLCAMQFQGTKAELERRIDFVDIHLRDVPHGQTIRTGDGPERRLTMRETFAHILEYLDRIDPDRIVSVDLAPFEEYWRQTVLSCFPPDKRHDSEDVKRRLRKKGDYLIVLPSGSIPVLCASMMHFDVESASGVNEYCVVKTSMPPTVYRRKNVLGQKIRYRENGRIIFCYGDSDSVNNFIQGQRGGNTPDVHDILRRYAVDILGWPHATAEHYASQDCPILDGLTPSGR